ncbi:hypothetical protein KC322_g19526, partial [Hortaea werneckii]
MSTPTKRRKKNDYQASPQAARGLDFFFGKQRAKEVKTQESNEHEENATSAVGEAGVHEDYGEE